MPNEIHSLEISFPWMFIALWVSISYIISFCGGWYSLSKRYRLSEPYPKGLCWLGWHSGGFIWAGYRSCLWIAPHPTGLFIKTGPWLLFRAGHPPVFIPWKEFKALKHHKFLFLKWDTIELAQSPWLVI